MIRIFLVLLAFSAPAFSQSKPADPYEAVIAQQLDAFQSDDFARAFTFASPMIKGMFGTPERFGQMVEQGYPMVHRPAEVRYGAVVSDGRRVVKTVWFTDQAGRRFEAAYEMIQAGGIWQINGVSIREADLGV